MSDCSSEAAISLESLPIEEAPPQMVAVSLTREEAAASARAMRLFAMVALLTVVADQFAKALCGANSRAICDTITITMTVTPMRNHRWPDSIPHAAPRLRMCEKSSQPGTTS